ncbi:MAG: hypothetical protein M0030_19185 [Actinomycetota bacterium]|nr:hypothetical protein [Actinomycetota bacterium]
MKLALTRNLALTTSPATDAGLEFMERHCADLALFDGAQFQTFVSLAVQGDVLHAVREYRRLYPGASVREGKFAAMAARARARQG